MVLYYMVSRCTTVWGQWLTVHKSFSETRWILLKILSVSFILITWVCWANGILCLLNQHAYKLGFLLGAFTSEFAPGSERKLIFLYIWLVFLVSCCSSVTYYINLHDRVASCCHPCCLSLPISDNGWYIDILLCWVCTMVWVYVSHDLSWHQYLAVFLDLKIQVCWESFFNIFLTCCIRGENTLFSYFF